MLWISDYFFSLTFTIIIINKKIYISLFQDLIKLFLLLSLPLNLQGHTLKFVILMTIHKLITSQLPQPLMGNDHLFKIM